MNILPTSDKALVRPIEASTKSKFGIELVTSSKPTFFKGTVLAVGPGKRTKDGTLVPMEVIPGDHILLNIYSGSKFEVNGDPHLLVREEEILAKLIDPMVEIR